LNGPLIISEKKGGVLADWAAEGETKLILFDYRPGLAVTLQEEIIGVESIIAEKLPQIAVQMIASGLAHNLHVGASAAPVICVIHTGLHFEFGDRVRSWNCNAYF